MTKQETTLLVEFGDDHCRNVYFPPLDRRCRGRFDALALAKHDPDAGQLVNAWPEPIAGQRLEVDPDTGECAIVEPLHDFPAIAAKLKSRGLSLAPAREPVTCDLPTLLFYLRAAVNGGKAKIVRGAIPPFDESKVRRDLFVAPAENPVATLATALTAQAKAFDRLADVLERALIVKK
jgi:hypothetical protein